MVHELISIFFLKVQAGTDSSNLPPSSWNERKKAPTPSSQNNVVIRLAAARARLTFRKLWGTETQDSVRGPHTKSEEKG